jgi:uncharacterized membrane protein YdbT with pleckstrin-like domain
LLPRRLKGLPRLHAPYSAVVVVVVVVVIVVVVVVVVVYLLSPTLEFL